jgi:shikimate kinase
MKKNIVLTGFMGSGKTVVGRNIASMLDWEFFDTDLAIQDVTGMPIAQIFKKHGELRFRSEEELVIRRLAQREHMVIASGGSLGPENNNLDLLSKGGFFVLLKAEPEIIYERLRRKNHRPLIGAKPDFEYVKSLLEVRNDHYEKMADLIVNTSEMSVEEAAGRICEKFRESNLA